jgi:ethanolamine permease
MTTGQTALLKVLKPIHLWALAVGIVISGEYFGWNYGWNVAGTGGFLIATLIVTVLYITFIFSFTELTASIPHAGGPFAYAWKAFGPLGGLIAGYATLVEFLIAPPAVALALGGYIHFLFPAVQVLPVAIGAFVLFTALNMFGIKESAMFSLIVTIVAVAGLVIFMGITAPHFRTEYFMKDAMPSGVGSIFEALPFAIWFYLAIEGVAMVAEEVKDPRRNIPRGYIYGIATLVLLAIGVMIFAGGVTDWHNLSRIDYPLPEAVAVVLGRENGYTKIFAVICIFGLVASFHSVIIGYSRQVYAMARSGYLPSALATLNPRFHTPNAALIAGGLVGIITLCTGTTDKIIILSALGAVVMYIISMISLFVLRKKEPALDRPFKVPFYPVFPAVALLLSVVCMVAIIWYNLLLSLIFFSILIIIIILYKILKSRNPQISQSQHPTSAN